LILGPCGTLHIATFVYSAIFGDVWSFGFTFWATAQQFAYYCRCR